MKNERYIKLESVGCWFDLKTGYTFPILEEENVKVPSIKQNQKEPTFDINGSLAVHLKDCAEEWLEYLEGFDETIVGIWFKANRK